MATTTMESQSGTEIRGEFARGWKGRGRLGDMLDELQRQLETTTDVVISSSELEIAVDESTKTLMLHRKSGSDMRVREWIPSAGLPIHDDAMTQLCGRAKPSIPVRFMRSLIDERPVMAQQLATDLMQNNGEPWLIRMMDDHVRAILSKGYFPIPHLPIVKHVLGRVRDKGGEIIECCLNNRGMRIKMTNRAIFDAIDEERGKGPTSSWYAGALGEPGYASMVSAKERGSLPGGPGTLHPLITLGNSETGFGRLYERLGLLRAICFNLATVEEVMARIHVHTAMDLGIIRHETIVKKLDAIYSELADGVDVCFDPERFKILVNLARAAQGIKVKPVSAVEWVQEKDVISEAEKDSLLAYFCGGDVEPNTVWGLAQAVGRMAQDTENPDRADQLEEFAGSLISSPKLPSAVLA